MRDNSERRIRGPIHSAPAFFCLTKAEQVNTSNQALLDCIYSTLSACISRGALIDRPHTAETAERLSRILEFLDRRGNRFRASNFTFDPAVIRSFKAYFEATPERRRDFLHEALKECFYLSRDRTLMLEFGWDAHKFLAKECIFATVKN